MSGREMVKRAIDYANAPEHGNQGYDVRVFLANGNHITGTVDRRSIGESLVLYKLNEDLDRREPIWIDFNAISAVGIVW